MRILPVLLQQPRRGWRLAPVGLVVLVGVVVLGFIFCVSQLAAATTLDSKLDPSADSASNLALPSEDAKTPIEGDVSGSVRISWGYLSILVLPALAVLVLGAKRRRIPPREVSSFGPENF